jgi:hypothetical protein
VCRRRGGRFAFPVSIKRRTTGGCHRECQSAGGEDC